MRIEGLNESILIGGDYNLSSVSTDHKPENLVTITIKWGHMISYSKVGINNLDIEMENTIVSWT